MISFSVDREHGCIQLHVYVEEDLCTAEFSDMDIVAGECRRAFRSAFDHIIVTGLF